MKTWILGGLGIVFVLLIGLGTGLFVSGALQGDAADNDEEQTEEGVAEGEEQRPEAIYYEMTPAFVVNVEAERRVRYLQVKVEVMARDQAVIDAVDRHMPQIRNELLLLFSDLEYDKVQNREGRETLQQATREQIVSVLEAEEEPAEVEAVYFTNFVMQ